MNRFLIVWQPSFDNYTFTVPETIDSAATFSDAVDIVMNYAEAFHGTPLDFIIYDTEEGEQYHVETNRTEG